MKKHREKHQSLLHKCIEEATVKFQKFIVESAVNLIITKQENTAINQVCKKLLKIQSKSISGVHTKPGICDTHTVKISYS